MLRCDQLLTIAIRTLRRMNLQFADHAVRVAYGLMRILDGEPGFSQEEVDRLACTALFHDIGLLHDDEDADLLQRESAAEWAHPRYAYVYLKRLGPFPQEAAIIRYHHSGSLEIEDSGLPDHLKLAANYLLALDTSTSSGSTTPPSPWRRRPAYWRSWSPSGMTGGRWRRWRRWWIWRMPPRETPGRRSRSGRSCWGGWGRCPSPPASWGIYFTCS